MESLEIWRRLGFVLGLLACGEKVSWVIAWIFRTIKSKSDVGSDSLVSVIVQGSSI